MSKNLGGYGDGGLITTSNGELAARVRSLRDHGQAQRGCFGEIGYNSRLDEIQAAILNVKFKRLQKWNEARRQKADYYNEKLAGLDLTLPYAAPEVEHAYHLYTIRSKQRERLAAALQAAEIGFATHYKQPPHTHPACATLGLNRAELPETNRAAAEVLQLPMYPELTFEQMDYVCDTLKKALA
jgi:dTDP-4-amino-4,6-dideoxygalactose transaminase